MAGGYRRPSGGCDQGHRQQREPQADHLDHAEPLAERHPGPEHRDRREQRRHDRRDRGGSVPGGGQEQRVACGDQNRDPDDLVLFAALRRAVEAGQAAGEIRPGDARLVAQVLWSGIELEQRIASALQCGSR